MERYIGKNIKKFDEIEDESLKEKIWQFMEILKKENIFILSGELENFYKTYAKNATEGVYGKEEKVIRIIEDSIEKEKSITEYIEYREFFKFFKIFCKKCLGLEVFSLREDT